MEKTWYVEKRVFSDGSVAYVHKMTYGKFRIGISPDEESPCFDSQW